MTPYRSLQALLIAFIPCPISLYQHLAGLTNGYGDDTQNILNLGPLLGPSVSESPCARDGTPRREAATGSTSAL